MPINKGREQEVIRRVFTLEEQIQIVRRNRFNEALVQVLSDKTEPLPRYKVETLSKEIAAGIPFKTTCACLEYYGIVNEDIEVRLSLTEVGRVVAKEIK